MLHKLNVLPSARRRGIGGALVIAAETHAHELGAREMTLWSDTRFIESHALYAKLGYERLPGTRDLHDLSNTTEYCFRKGLQAGFDARK
jgi:putative acetyltransferase